MNQSNGQQKSDTSARGSLSAEFEQLLKFWRLSYTESLQGRSDNYEPPNLTLDKLNNMKYSTESEKLKYGILEFNKNPESGILHLCHFSDKAITPTDPRSVANFLLNQGLLLKKSAIGLYIGQPSNSEILTAYVSKMNFTNMPLLDAIRELKYFVNFPKDAPATERILRSFAEKYCRDNSLQSPNMCFILSYSIVVLNQNLINCELLETTASHLYESYADKDADSRSFDNNILQNARIELSKRPLDKYDIAHIFQNVTKKGTLRIKDTMNKQGKQCIWTWRLFTLYDDELYYFENTENVNCGGVMIPLKNIKVQDCPIGHYPHCIELSHVDMNSQIEIIRFDEQGNTHKDHQSNIILRADTEEICRSWMNTLIVAKQRGIEEINNKNCSHAG